MGGLLAAACVAIVSVPASAQRAPLGEIPDEPVERTLDHYPESNEHRHDLFFPSIAGRGGAFLGVGSDQSYSLAAAAGSELVFLVDYDPVVSRLHRALAVLIRSCPEVSCLRARLAPAAEVESARAIASELGDGWEARRTVHEFMVHRALLRSRIERSSGQESWINRADWYAHVHRLSREHRIIARTADLRGPSTLRAVGRAAAREGIRFEVLYLSNAEEYFRYEPSFVANLAALPATDRAIVLRTLRDRRLARAPGDHAWHYDVQPLADLLGRIRDRGYADSSYLVRDLVDGRVGLRDAPSMLDARVPSRALPGPRRWWLDASVQRPRERAEEARESRVLRTFRRAARSAFEGEEAARLAAVDLEGTALAGAGPAALPHDPRTRAPFVLSGEPVETSVVRAEVPEDALHALLLDATVRDLLAPLFTRVAMHDEAAMLVRAPVSADLYAAYRLRERLLEVCPSARVPRGPASAALRACRDVSNLVRPVPTRRAQPEWPERERRIAQALRAVALALVAIDPANAERTLRISLTRLAAIARGMRPLEGSAASAPRDP